MSLTEHLALVFHVFIAVDVMVMVCGRHGCGRHGHGLWPSWLWPSWSWFVAVMVVAVMVDAPSILFSISCTLCVPNIMKTG